mgnify:CR=1 FL=1
MKLKVIKAMLKYFCIDTVVIIITFIGLLPLEISEEKLAIINLFPVFAG